MKRRFIQQDTNKEKGLKLKWRKPRGRHSKLRLNKAGHAKKPSPGFRRSLADRFKHPSGLQVEVITNIKQLSNLKEKGAIISSSLGLKKKIEVLNKAIELKINVLNVKNVEDFIKKSQESVNQRKEAKKKKQTEKKKSKEESLKKAEKQKEKEINEDKKEEIKKSKPEIKDQPKQDIPKKEVKTIQRAKAPMQK